MIDINIKTRFQKLIIEWNKRYADQPFDWAKWVPHIAYGGCDMLSYKLHWANRQIWYYEDRCRSGIDSEICECKPLIDKHNQLRNDTIEHIDELIIFEQEKCDNYVTETPGSIVDRLSILTLKEYHWKLIQHNYAGRYADRIEIVEKQLAFLSEQLNLLQQDIVSGKRNFKLFKQLKMYNNPDTNPKMKR